MFEIHSQVHLNLPLEQMVPKDAAPHWIAAVLGRAAASMGSIEIDAQNRVEIDPLHRLTGFRSSIRPAKVPQAIVITGTMEGSRLKVHFDMGDLPLKPIDDDYLSPDAAGGRRTFTARPHARLARRPDVDGAGL